MILVIPLLFSGFTEDKKFYSQKFKFENLRIENIHFKSPRIFDYIFEENRNKKLLMLTDIFGKEVNYRKNTPLFYIYDDKTVEKRIVIE